MKYLIAMAVFNCLMACAQAKPYIPASPEEVIAVWDKSASRQLQNFQIQHWQTQNHLQPQDVATLTQLANQYLQQAAQPGFAYLYGVTEALLKPAINNNIQDTSLLLAWAQVLQHQHKFVPAQDVLQKIFTREPNHITANLLAARLQLIQGNPAAAQPYCLTLLGHADLLTLSACSLEVRSHLGEKALTESYAQLQQLLASQGLPDDERQLWILQMLADMAVRLQHYAEARNFLEKITQPKTLSVWVQWADIQIALDNNQLVSEKITEIIKRNTQIDDALLIRLVIAEKKLAGESQWQTQLQERIALREMRDDQAHAADLALYYLAVSSDPQKALYWAERNWLDAREPGDQQLLMRAQQLAGTTGKMLEQNSIPTEAQ